MSQFLNIKQVCSDMGGVSKSSIYNLINSGFLTKPVKPMGGRAARWLKSELDAILSAQIAGKSGADIRDLVALLHAKRLGVAA